MTWQEDDEKRKIRAELDGLRRDVDKAIKNAGDGSLGCITIILFNVVFILVLESPLFKELGCFVTQAIPFLHKGC